MDEPGDEKVKEDEVNEEKLDGVKLDGARTKAPGSSGETSKRS